MSYFSEGKFGAVGQNYGGRFAGFIGQSESEELVEAQGIGPRPSADVDMTPIDQMDIPAPAAMPSLPTAPQQVAAQAAVVPVMPTANASAATAASPKKNMFPAVLLLGLLTGGMMYVNSKYQEKA